MMSVVCEFCGTKLNSTSSLNLHKKTAKYCLKIRGDNDGGVQQNCCEWCDTTFLRKSALQTHVKICSGMKKSMAEDEAEKVLNLERNILACQKQNEKLEVSVKQYKTKYVKLVRTNSVATKKFMKDIEELTKSLDECEKKLVSQHNEHQIKLQEKDKKIAELEKKLEYGKGILTGIDRAKPTTKTVKQITNNNNVIVNQKLASIPITTIQPLTSQMIENSVEKYTEDLFMRGVGGIVQYIENMTTLKIGNSIERNYACTNKSGNVFHRLLKSKEWKQDGGAKYINEVLDSLVEPANEYLENLREYVRDNKDDEYHGKKLGKLTTLVNAMEHNNGHEREKIHRKIRNEISYSVSV